MRKKLIMKKLLTILLLLFMCFKLQSQTVTLPHYYGVQNKPDFICGESTVTDYQGNVYNTVKIGSQCWLKQNLRSTKYNDGTNIPNVTNNTTWSNLTTPAYCWYNNDYSTYGSVYGALYNWYTVNTGKLCPLGWHVPSDAEWTELSDYLGGESIAGGKLKEAGTAHWLSPNIGATNQYGFTALPGGWRGCDGKFYNIGNVGYWWSASVYIADVAWERDMFVWSSDAYRDLSNILLGLSVRCVRD